MGSKQYNKTGRKKNPSKPKKEHGDSPTVTTFFKIMEGEKFNKVMVLPSTFSDKRKLLVGQKITLQDSNRLNWDVILSNVDGSPAIQKGWRYFVFRHGIELGDVLFFHHYKHSFFRVDIFDRNGCKKITPCENKTAKTMSGSIPKKRPCNDSHEQPARKQQATSRSVVGSTASSESVHNKKRRKEVPQKKPSSDEEEKIARQEELPTCHSGNENDKFVNVQKDPIPVENVDLQSDYDDLPLELTIPLQMIYEVESESSASSAK